MEKQNLAPIALFVYNRPAHTEQTLNALANNLLAKESELFIFSDGPKDILNTDSVNRVRDVIKKFSDRKFKKVTIIESDKNKGLANSIVQGVTELINKFGKIIVLEDDLVTSKFFLKFMNDSLNFYSNIPQVMNISAYVLPVNFSLKEDSFLLRNISSWGWATWKRSWDKFNFDAGYLMDQIKNSNRVSEFNLDNSYNFYQHLELNQKGEWKTWAIKWQASVFINDGLCLYPRISLIENIGHDNSGSHDQQTRIFDVATSRVELEVSAIPIVENKIVVSKIKEFYKRNDLKPKFINKLRKKLLSINKIFIKR